MLGEWVARMGPLAGPLLFCSLATVALAVERLLFFLRHGTRLTPSPLEAIGHHNPMLDQGLRVMRHHRRHERTLREEAMVDWLHGQRRRLHAHLGWLQLLAVVSPLLGLLGTIVGMIQAFQTIAGHTGPVYPALIADGLWTAMLTTAAGLAIAVPALVAVHGFRIWARFVVDRLSTQVRRWNLALEGVEPVAPAEAAGPWGVRGEPATS